MMLSLQDYSFRVEYHKGMSLDIADMLSRAPLSMTSHKEMHDEFVYLTELEFNSTGLSGFQDATLQDIRAASSPDPDLMVLRPFIESGWPNDKAAVLALAQPYWSIYHELTQPEGLFFKQDRVIKPLSLRQKILHKPHAAH